jgi:hypothetical protein
MKAINGGFTLAGTTLMGRVNPQNNPTGLLKFS